MSKLFANPFSKLIGDKILLKKFKHYIATAVDMQAGNIRYDFAERLNKSKVKFIWVMLDKISNTIEGIENAIKKLAKKDKGESGIKEREKKLMELKNKNQQIESIYKKHCSGFR